MSTCNCIVEVPGCLVRQGGGEHAPAGGRVEEKGWTGSKQCVPSQGAGGEQTVGRGLLGGQGKKGAPLV